MDLVMMRGRDAVCGSVEVAEHFGKRHDKLLFEIERKYPELIGDFNVQNGGVKLYQKSFYESRGKRYPMYLMNRDGFVLLVISFTGKEAIDWKIKYIEAFNRMEQIIAQKQTEAYKDTRAYQKTIRRQETDAIKALVEYAEGQGSRNASRYYAILSKLADRTAGIEDRETADIRQICTLAMVEDVISKSISDGIAAQEPYKDIYQGCRQRLEQFRTAALIG